MQIICASLTHGPWVATFVSPGNLMDSISPDQLKALRRARQLHPQVEARLQQLLGKARMDGFALPEGWGLAGNHRTDVVAYLHERNILHLEIFGSASNVHRDVNILLMSQADVKVALIMDEEADPRVAKAYFGVVADNRFHWFWLSQFLDPNYEDAAISILVGLLREAQDIGGPLVAQRPTVTMHPSVGAPFSLSEIRVTGFHPDREFSVFWEPEGVTTLLGVGRSITETGAGECKVVIPHGGAATPGRHIVRAVDSLGNFAVTEFDITSGWPAPSIRAVPGELKPGDSGSVVGGGAPRSTSLTVFLC